MAPGRRLRAAADVTGAAVLLAGLPWGLGGLAGPPLPGHWPGWQQVREFLASPLSDGTAIRVLAGAAWLLWAVFAVAVIAEVTAAACGRPVPRLPAIAPVQALAATLAGTVVITALHLPRTAARAAQPPHAVLTATVTTAGPAPARGRRRRRPAGHRRPVPRQRRGPAPDLLAGRGPRRRDIRAGRDRTTGCTPSWPATTCGTWPAPTSAAATAGTRSTTSTAAGRSPAGATLTDPARIYPGWDLLIPAAGPHPQHGRGNPPGAGRPDRHPRTPAPAATGSPGPARSPHPARSTPATGRPGARQHVPPAGVRLPSGALIGLGTAVAVSTAVALARIHRRRRYRPGTVLTSSLEPAGPPPPVIAALDRAARTPATGTPPADGTGPDDTEPDPDLDLYEPYEQPLPGPRDPGAAAPAPARLASGQPPGQQGTVPAPPGPVPIGIRGGQEITADPAALGGLGLTGPGAPAAARAILAGLLARPPRGQDGTPAEIIIPAADAARLLPGRARAAGSPAHPRRLGAARTGHRAR